MRALEPEAPLPEKFASPSSESIERREVMFGHSTGAGSFVPGAKGPIPLSRTGIVMVPLGYQM